MKIFENIKYQQIRALLEVLNEVKEKNQELIKQRYKNFSENYDGAKDFLKKLNILKEKNDILSISKSFIISGDHKLLDETLKELLIDELLSNRSSLSNEVDIYLDNFKLIQNSFEYKPRTSSRLKENWIRNLLIELDLVEYDQNSQVYRLSEKYFNSLEIFRKRKKMTPIQMTLILKKKEELGKAAELFVLQYEQERLSSYPELINNIKHVAIENVLAGYDILSWETEKQEGKAIPRYIEVKAISKGNTNFFWSRNEVSMAKKFAERYYLYLLPVIGDDFFDRDALEIIPNPSREVFNNSNEWEWKTEMYLVSKIEKR